MPAKRAKIPVVRRANQRRRSRATLAPGCIGRGRERRTAMLARFQRMEMPNCSRIKESCQS